MATPVPDETLDAILAMQLTIRWAGEGRCLPRRLGWWDPDLFEEAGNGDFLARLLPQTDAWAPLETVREAARRTDAKARIKMPDPDKMRTLYLLGFELDEHAVDRHAALPTYPPHRLPAFAKGSGGGLVEGNRARRPRCGAAPARVARVGTSEGATRSRRGPRSQWDAAATRARPSPHAGRERARARPRRRLNSAQGR